jgi:hypothetical protein
VSMCVCVSRMSRKIIKSEYPHTKAIKLFFKRVLLHVISVKRSLELLKSAILFRERLTDAMLAQTGSMNFYLQSVYTLHCNALQICIINFQDEGLVWCPGQNKRIAPLSFLHGCRKRRLKE